MPTLAPAAAQHLSGQQRYAPRPEPGPGRRVSSDVSWPPRLRQGGRHQIGAAARGRPSQPPRSRVSADDRTESFTISRGPDVSASCRIEYPMPQPDRVIIPSETRHARPLRRRRPLSCTSARMIRPTHVPRERSLRSPFPANICLALRSHGPRAIGASSAELIRSTSAIQGQRSLRPTSPEIIRRTSTFQGRRSLRSPSPSGTRPASRTIHPC